MTLVQNATSAGRKLYTLCGFSRPVKRYFNTMHIGAKSSKNWFKKASNGFESPFTCVFMTALVIPSQFWNFLYWHKPDSCLYHFVDFHWNWTKLNNFNVWFSNFYLFQNANKFWSYTMPKVPFMPKRYWRFETKMFWKLDIRVIQCCQILMEIYQTVQNVIRFVSM